MTYRQFLEKLSKTPRDWFVSFDGAIRRSSEEGPFAVLNNSCGQPSWKHLEWECPLSALKAAPSNLGRDVGFILGLSKENVDAIVVAADVRTISPHLIPIREDLLGACGIKP